MDKSSKKFLKNYLNSNSPTGFESEGQKVWLDYLKPYVDEYFVDTYGSFETSLDLVSQRSIIMSLW